MHTILSIKHKVDLFLVENTISKLSAKLHYGTKNEDLGVVDQEILLLCLCFFGERNGGGEKGELQGPVECLLKRGQKGD